MKTPRQCLAWWLPKHDLVQYSKEDRVYEEPVRLPFLIKWCFQKSICPGHFYEGYEIGIIWKGDSTDLEDIEGKFMILILFLPFNIHHLISTLNICMNKYRVGSLQRPERIFNLQTWVTNDDYHWWLTMMAAKTIIWFKNYCEFLKHIFKNLTISWLVWSSPIDSMGKININH